MWNSKYPINIKFIQSCMELHLMRKQQTEEITCSIEICLEATEKRH